MCRLCLEVSAWPSDVSPELVVILTNETQVGQFVRLPEMREELLRILDNMLRISKFPGNGLVARLKKVWQE